MKKNPNITIVIQRYSLVGAIHWYVYFNDENGIPPYIPCKKFRRYADARRYALKHAYAKNIQTRE